MRSAPAAVALLCACAVTERAAAEVRLWHVGLNARTDLGTHQLRVTGGVATGPWDLSLVLDPLAFTDAQHDADLLAEWMFSRDRFGLLLGWRLTSIGIAGGTHHQHRSLVGLTAALPSLLDGRIRSRWSLELSTQWVKHGGGLETEWIPFDRSFHDHVSFAMFVRVEYAAGL